MPVRQALLLPVASLLAVAAILGAVLLFQLGGSPRTALAPTPAPSTADAGSVHLKPSSSVCQSVLNRPPPGAPKHFPEIYTQQRDVRGMTVVATANVPTEALDVAEQTIRRVFRDNDLIDPLVQEGAYVIVADRSQGVLDLPEFGCLEDELGADFFTHVCGVADRADYPVATVNELDLLGDPTGPCGGLNILYHELGHLVQGWTLPPADYFDVKLLYQAAKDAGKYRRAYAATNPNEYFAEGTQAYFLSQARDGSLDRQWLQQYDPDLYALLDRIYNP